MTKTPYQILNYNPIELTADTRACKQCGKTFQLPASEILRRYKLACDDCCDAEAVADGQRQAKEGRRVLEAAWARYDPFKAQPTDLSRHPNIRSYDRVMLWDGKKGALLLHGETGRGKSRALFALVKREWLTGRTVSVLDDRTAMHYAAKCSTAMMTADQWVTSQCEVDFLAMDDIFKGKLTESWEAALFSIVKSRIEAGRPFIVSTQDTVGSMLSRMSDDRGSAIARRMEQFCEVISF